MADRAFVFSHPEVQSLLREKFVALALNDWYLRRQDDEVGRFYRKMTEASPRGNAGEATRQGRYVFTAAGTFLGFNNNRGPERLLKMLNESLAAWEKLPEEKRTVTQAVSAANPDKVYHREPPPGGAILRCYTRLLDRSSSAPGYQRAALPKQDEPDHRGSTTGRDYVWLQQEELTALAAQVQADKPSSVAPVVLNRLLRFHLVDNTRGEPPAWKLDEIKTATLTITPGPRPASPDQEASCSARLDGKFTLKSTDGSRSLRGSFSGEIAFQHGELTRLDLLALGLHAGDGTYNRGARPGESPIGFSIRLVNQPQPSDKIAPQFSHYLRGYWQAQLP